MGKFKSKMVCRLIWAKTFICRGQLNKIWSTKKQIYFVIILRHFKDRVLLRGEEINLQYADQPDPADLRRLYQTTIRTICVISILANKINHTNHVTYMMTLKQLI